MNIEKSNAETTERMMEARPIVVGMGKAIDVIPGMRKNLLLHAGPPITWKRASGPMRGAIIGALVFEGKAKNEAEAQALVESGEIELEPCHHHQAGIPQLSHVSRHKESLLRFCAAIESQQSPVQRTGFL